MTITRETCLPPTIAAVRFPALGVGSAGSEDMASDGGEPVVFGSAQMLAGQRKMETLTGAHTNKGSGSGKVEIAFLLLGPEWGNSMLTNLAHTVTLR